MIDIFQTLALIAAALALAVQRRALVRMHATITETSELQLRLSNATRYLVARVRDLELRTKRLEKRQREDQDGTLGPPPYFHN